jgi:hypothetical protein
VGNGACTGTAVAVEGGSPSGRIQSRCQALSPRWGDHTKSDSTGLLRQLYKGRVQRTSRDTRLAQQSRTTAAAASSAPERLQLNTGSSKSSGCACDMRYPGGSPTQASWLDQLLVIRHRPLRQRTAQRRAYHRIEAVLDPECLYSVELHSKLTHATARPIHTLSKFSACIGPHTCHANTNHTEFASSSVPRSGPIALRGARRREASLLSPSACSPTARAQHHPTGTAWDVA